MQMMRVMAAIALLACGGASGPAGVQQGTWRNTGDPTVRVEYQDADAALAATMLEHARAGRAAATAFFGEGFTSGLTVRVYPDRSSLTAYWRGAWNQPSLVPECWMVASATRAVAVSLSPRVWAQAACGHDPANETYVRRIVSHEIVHVLHGQLNSLPEINAVGALKWLNEGVAYYAAGQLDDGGRARLRSLLASGYSPASLESILSGQGGYGAAASVMAYIDVQYGRAMLRRLLKATSTSEALGMLGVTEADLLQRWKLRETGDERGNRESGIG